MNQSSPLNLTKDISKLENAINSLLEMGKPEPNTRFWAKVTILRQRLELMRDGMGFSGSFTHVSDKEADNLLKEQFSATVRQRLSEIVKSSEINAGTLEYAYWIGGALAKKHPAGKYFITGYRTLKLYYSPTGRSVLNESSFICDAKPDTAVDVFEKHIINESV